MDRPIFETYRDDRGNLGVRVSQEICVLDRAQQEQLKFVYQALRARNAKLVELLLKSFELMHRGGLTTGAYGPCMELFEEAEDIGVIVPFMSELGIEDE